MKQAYVIITRHEKREEGRKGPAGGTEDRTQVGLSEEGKRNAYALGEQELAGKGIDRVVVITSGFLRTDQTAEGILQGAGFDVERDVYGRADRARIVRDSRLGLGGTTWGVPGPKFSIEQEQLNRYVNHLLAGYWLEHENKPGNPENYPVLALRSAAMLEALTSGLEELAVSLQPQQQGALIVVTHGPILDSLAVAYNSKLQTEPMRETTGEGRDLFRVHLEPIEAHNQGHYMKGTVSLETSLANVHIPLAIKGEEVVHTLRAIKDNAWHIRYQASCSA